MWIWHDENGKLHTYTWEDWCDDHIVLFPVLADCKGLPFDISRVHPIKQREVRDVYNLLRVNNNVLRVWVFGSAANMKCVWESDLDLAIEVSEDCTAIERSNISADIGELCVNGHDVVWWDSLRYGSKFYGKVMRGVQII